jgi:hypothetical protein
MPLIGSSPVMAAMLPRVKLLRLNARAGVPRWKLKLPLVFAGHHCWVVLRFRKSVRPTMSGDKQATTLFAFKTAFLFWKFNNLNSKVKTVGETP